VSSKFSRHSREYHKIVDISAVDVNLLIAKLDGLPLALAQAGSFIGRTGVDVPKYIVFFDETWSALMQKHDQFPLDGYDGSMLTTWKLSYDQVLRQSETAAWLLRLWAFFHHDDFWFGIMAESVNIPFYLEEGEEFDMPTWLAELSGCELEFSSAMGLLKAYSLAESTGEGSYTMHSVLHRWSRSLSLDVDAASLISISICVLASAIPDEEDATSWQLERRMLQHVLQACNELSVTPTLAQQELPGRATHRLGDLLRDQEKLNDAEQMYQRAMSAGEKALGPNHTSTLVTVHNLGMLYWKQGKPEEAEQMYQRALHVYEKELGPDHISTIQTVICLGVLYSEQGKLNEAEEMFQHALTSHEQTYGKAALTVEFLGTVNNFGILYRKQGRLDEAVEMVRRALAGYEKMNGKEALTVPLLKSVYSLGLLYCDQGRLDEAEQNLERALAGYQEIYGRSHKQVEEVSEDLALVRAGIGELPHLQSPPLN
jgi:tetratricopeptide (TPR) repeat protein